MPPLPKPPKLRQRRNRETTARELTAEKRRTYAPRLPDRGPGQEWDRRTVAWWKDVWHSPMAAEFLQADIHALYRLAELVEMFWREPDKALAAEIRLEQQAFGLTPIDRRRLQWSIDEEDARRPQPRVAEAAEDQEHVRVDARAMAEAQLEDPRRLLGVVA